MFIACDKVRRVEELNLKMTSEEEDCEVMSSLVMRMRQGIEVFGRN